MAPGIARLALLGVVAGSLAVRLWTIGERSFWFDEAFSYTLARESTWNEMLQRTAGDVHPPLFYAALCLWSHLAGTSVIGLRMFSVYWSAMTMIGCFLFCRDALADALPNAGGSRSDGCWIGVSAAALIGACSLHISWSQEARMYTLGTALVFFSTWMLVRALRAGERGQKWWCGYVLCATAFAYTHNFALFSIAGQGLFCIAIHWRNGWKLARTAVPKHRPADVLSEIRAPGRSAATIPIHDRGGDAEDLGRATNGVGPIGHPQRLSALLAFAIVALVYLPWAGKLLAQTERTGIEYWTRPLNLWTIPDCLGGLIVPANSYDNDPLISVVAAAACAVILGLLAWMNRPGSWLLSAMIVIPLLCAAAVSLIRVPIFVSRYFLFAHMFILCAVPYIASHVLFAGFRTVLVGVLIANSLFGHAIYWSSLETKARPGIRGAANHVAGKWKRGEEVVVTHPTIFFSTRYYLRGIVTPRLFVPKGTRPHYLGGSAVAREWMIDEYGLQSDRFDRIWVVDVAGDVGRPPLPGEWRRVPESTRTFPDVYYFLGTVTTTEYERATTPGKSEGISAIGPKVQ